MKRLFGLAAFGAVLACAPAQAQQITAKVGVLTDMSSLYADLGGQGSVVAAQMAAADFMKDHPNVKVEVVSGDHQNKPDVGTNLANQWYDVDKVDVIVDVLTSSVALAVSQVAANKDKLVIVSGAAASDLTGPKCNANTLHWAYDTWMLANGTGTAMVKNGGDTWFFITADYAFGHALERDTSAVGDQERRQGGRCGSRSDQHLGLLVVPAAGAGVEGQGDRARQRRRRHHQLDQAGIAVRHRQGWAKARRPSGVRQRRQRARLGDRARAVADRDLVLGPERRQPRLDQALDRAAQGRQQIRHHDPCRRLFQRPPLSEGASWRWAAILAARRSPTR